jgi:hypothetical protein
MALRRTVDRFSDDLKSRFELGHTLALAGDTAEAVAVCEAAVRAAPPSADNLITLAAFISATDGTRRHWVSEMRYLTVFPGTLPPLPTSRPP